MNALSRLTRPDFIGFGDMFRDFERLSSVGTFPPHNLIKCEGGKHRVEMALAGYTEDDVIVEVENSTLTVSGGKLLELEGEEYTHKGISSKAFKRTFKLSEDLIVDGCEFKNGLLTIHLHEEKPEEEKPQRVPFWKK